MFMNELLQVITTQELQAAIDSTIKTSTNALVAYQEKEGIGGENRAKAAGQISRVSQIVRENPDRVAADIGRQSNELTEYDPERAYLEALAIDGNESRLAAEKRRETMGKRLSRFFGGLRRHDQNKLGSLLGAKLANDLYDEDPIESGLGTVKLWVDRAAHNRRSKSYKFVRPAKSVYKISENPEPAPSKDPDPITPDGPEAPVLASSADAESINNSDDPAKKTA